jgi:cadmium resistance protein CadD (predicted permease)
MNGHLLPILLTIIGGLLGLVQILFGIILKLHKDHDDERMRELKEEIDRMRKTLHEWSPHIGWVDQQRRWDGRDRRDD